MYSSGMRNLPTHVVVEESGEDCMICLATMLPGEIVTCLPYCQHIFHLSCIVEWFTVKLKSGAVGCCPLCNTETIKPRLSTTPPLVTGNILLDLSTLDQEHVGVARLSPVVCMAAVVVCTFIIIFLFQH